MTVLAISECTVEFPRLSKALSMTGYLAMMTDHHTFPCSVLGSYLLFLRKDVSWRVLPILYSHEKMKKKKKTANINFQKVSHSITEPTLI